MGSPWYSRLLLVLAKQFLPRTCHSLVSSRLTRSPVQDQEEEIAQLLGSLDLVLSQEPWAPVAALSPLPVPWGLLPGLGVLVPLSKAHWEDLLLAPVHLKIP
ncbi:uncharacterized protein ACHE_70677A [Aspergillus chevalieri]|uniref:Uncharacterized protein n=1 Tax=Aspergillus chevalieri TaxID=182096 RepID=A0A7R7ZSM2_ASPCH|nr:uncharacterized protein ACHE_70677A [Aspergillus chevalieri]BCR91834.1 hypothetical protein ACHE_70677A [Aspergillus chevalieri]